MKLSPSDLLSLKSWAKERFLRLNGRVFGMKGEMSHGDKIAVAYFEASICLLLSKNIPMDQLLDTEFPLEIPDSDPETEYSDWIPDPD